MEKILKIIHDKTTPITLHPSHEGPLYKAVGYESTSTAKLRVPYNPDWGYLSIQILAQPYAKSNGSCTIGITCASDSADFRLFCYNASYAYWDCGSSRTKIDGMGYSNNPYIYVLIGNHYMVNTLNNVYVQSASTKTVTYSIFDESNIQLEIGAAKFSYIVLRDKDNNIVYHFQPQGNKLVDKITGLEWTNSSFVETSLRGAGSSKWLSITSFDGDGCTFATTIEEMQFVNSKNNKLQTIKNMHLQINSIDSMFKGASALTEVDIDLPTLTANTQFVCSGCSNLQRVNLTMPNLSRFGNYLFRDCKKLTYCNLECGPSFTGSTNNSIMSGCAALDYFSIVLPQKYSGWTRADVGIPSTAPCGSYRYVDDLGDGLVRITFTSQERPSYSITTSCMTFYPDGIHYLNEDCTQELVSNDYGTEDNPINVSMIRYATDDMCNIFRSDNLQFGYDVWMVAYNNSKQGIDLWIDDGLTRIAEIPYGGSVKLHVTNTSIAIIN